MLPFHLVCCWFLNILHTVWVVYTLHCIVGLGFEENSLLYLPRDNVWKSVFWTDTVYFKRCPVLSKPDSAQPAKQTPADSLFLPLAHCPLTVWVHVCMRVCLNLPVKLCEDTSDLMSPHHTEMLIVGRCASLSYTMLHTEAGGWEEGARNAREPAHMHALFKGWYTQPDIEKFFGGWEKEYSGLHRRAITPHEH